jgi:enoyl-CoA hydratase/carnithine racemase
MDPKVDLMEEYYNVNAHVDARLGKFILNRHHKFNIFTKGFVEELHRALYGLEFMGDDIHAIYFGAKDPHTFSRGTDFKTLHHHAQHKEIDPVVEYLNGLFNFQIAFARNNKPLISDVRGFVENSANCLVGSAGIS